jgi:hypothetical protein
MRHSLPRLRCHKLLLPCEKMEEQNPSVKGRCSLRVFPLLYNPWESKGLEMFLTNCTLTSKGPISEHAPARYRWVRLCLWSTFVVTMTADSWNYSSQGVDRRTPEAVKDRFEICAFVEKTRKIIRKFGRTAPMPLLFWWKQGWFVC